MRIVFMGTPDFAVPSLSALLESGETVAAAFTQPDKPKGRGHRLQPPPVKMAAEEKGIPVYQPGTLRSDEAFEQLKALEPELIVVVAYGKLLPKAVLELPRYGCINVHGSLLPKYRGAAPIQWTVLNGDPIGGVTTMFMAEGLDTGDMLLKAETPVGENETSSELYERLSHLGAELLLKTVSELKAGELRPEPQDDQLATRAPMLTKEMGALDFTKPSEELHHLVCGLSEWPCAYTEFQGKRLKVYRSARSGLTGRPGEILDSKRMIVGCGSGSLELVEVQYEGSKRMSGGDFLRGRRLAAGDFIGKGE
ncbi:MAG: methionyl-tRNA formyltransferase [Oscillospiraceae bacterium]|nr:methionyl-tRNA formyltransferase [Oscillospiraceae bacterium]